MTHRLAIYEQVKTYLGYTQQAFFKDLLHMSLLQFCEMLIIAMVAPFFNFDVGGQKGSHIGDQISISN